MDFHTFKGRSAVEIFSTPHVDDSGWDIYMSLCWCDYAERTCAPQALHYAGYHLRTGIEYLWFTVLFAAQGGKMSLEEYRKSLKSTTTLYKLIDSRSPHYQKFFEFCEITTSLDSQRHPPMVFWDISKLKRIHGECSSRLLHFQGVPQQGYLSEGWITDRAKFLFESATWIFDTMRTRGNLVVFNPDGLKKPEVFSLWERYRDGKIDREEVRIGLKIVQPIVRTRPPPR